MRELMRRSPYSMRWNIRMRLGQRRRWPRPRYDGRQIAHRWGHWKQVWFELNVGLGPYRFNTYSFERVSLPFLRRDRDHRVVEIGYSPHWGEDDDEG